MILQYTPLLATYCNSYEFFLEHIVQLSPFSHIVTVPPDRWNLFNRLLHFFPLFHLVMSPILIKLEISALRRVHQVDSLFTQAQWLVLSLSSILLSVLSEILLRC